MSTPQLTLEERYALLSASNDKGWALAKSLQTQVDILKTAVDVVARMPRLDQDAHPGTLQKAVGEARWALIKLGKHRES